MYRKSLLFLLVSLAASMAAAQQPYLVKDINPPGEQWADPRPIAALGSILYFRLGASGDVWQTDGTADGTVRAPEFLQHYSHQVIAPLGDSIYYTRPTAELWRSDGVTAGELVKKFGSAPGGVAFADLVFASSDRLFISVGEDDGVPALWVSDGTEAGSVRISKGIRFPSPRFLGDAAGFTYFSNGNDLWVTDDTAAGTRKVFTLPGEILDAVPAGGLLHVLTLEGTTMRLWTSDGTTTGVSPVASFANQTGFRSGNLAAAGLYAYFEVRVAGGFELWRTDGSAMGTFAVKRFNGTVGPIGAVGDHVLFRGDEGLWVASGLPPSATLVKDFSPYGGLVWGETKMIEVDGVAYFSAHGSLGAELWRSDGTPEGTQLVGDIEPGAGDSYPRDFMRAGSKLFFSAETSVYGRELWALELPAPSPRLSINDVQVTESATSAQLTVTLSAPSSETVTVKWVTETGTAMPGNDYVTANGTLTFAPGETSKTISVALMPDHKVEENERIYIGLYDATVPLARNLGTLVIVDDDFATDRATFTHSARLLDHDRVLFTVRLRGRHGVAPTGSVTFARSQQQIGGPTPLQPSTLSGESMASVIVSGVADVPRLWDQSVTVHYSGDDDYPAAQLSGSLAPTPPDDFEGNGHSDILWRNTATGVNWIYTMTGGNIARSLLLDQVADQNWEIVGRADFDGDRDSDILWRHRVTGAGWMYLMDSVTIGRSVPVYLEPNLDWQIAAVADFDGDGRADIYWRHRHTGANYMYRMLGNEILASTPVSAVPDTQWRVAGTGDFDADGKADVFWRHAATGVTYVHFMNGSDITRAVYVATVADANWKVEAVRDFNRDGRADVFWRNGTTGQNWMYTMNGATVARSEPAGNVAPEFRVAAVGDYDDDSRTDILWRRTPGGDGLLSLMNGATVRSSRAIPIERASDWQIVK